MVDRRIRIGGALLLACVIASTCGEVRVDDAASASAGDPGSGAGGGGGPGTGGGGGVADLDAGPIEDADAAPADGGGISIDGGSDCASRPVTCQPSPQDPPDPDLATQALTDLFFQCCADISCGCNAMCQTTEVVFDDGGCAIERIVDGTMSPALADCLVEHLNAERWLCAAGQTVVHMPFCQPC